MYVARTELGMTCSVCCTTLYKLSLYFTSEFPRTETDKPYKNGFFPLLHHREMTQSMHFFYLGSFFLSCPCGMVVSLCVIHVVLNTKWCEVRETKNSQTIRILFIICYDKLNYL